MAASEPTVVPMDVEWQPSWLSWVGATTTCLRALGVECDCADVAGVSGYAFQLTIANDLCPSGPTVFDWNTLHPGIEYLGRSTETYVSYGPEEGAEERAACHAVYDLTAREVAEGRPCVIWGAYVPEFAAAIGVKDGAFLVKSFREVTREPQPPIPCEELQAPGGPYCLAFPAARPADREAGDRHAIRLAVERLRSGSSSGGYGCGPAAYEAWIACLEGEGGGVFGNAYSAQCYADGRSYAHEFLTRALVRHPEVVEPLERAVIASGTTASALQAVARLFPFPGQDELSDRARRGQAIELLRTAKDADAATAEALDAAVAAWPQE